jgi:hypothetical protein
MKLTPKPTFCFITPTAYLPKYASQSKMHLVLAHLVDTDPVYAEFYAHSKVPKIMDNGAFELGESYAPEKLIELGRKCKADAIVLPDYPGCPGQKTIEAGFKLMYDVKKAGFKTMFVPQSEIGDTEDWIQTYKWAAANPEIDIIGMSILSMPNALPQIERSFARVVLTQMLIDRGLFNFDKHHHYLGLNAGPALEIPSLLRMKALDSNDSSGPVWAGICGQEYTRSADSYQLTRKISKHVDFDYKLVHDFNVHRMIQNNIDLTNELFALDYPSGCC